MLRIRLLPVGRKNQVSYRFVVAEHSAPIQGKHLEVLGYYNPSDGKKVQIDEARVMHWIKMGAKPTDTAASLLKAQGLKGMESFIGPRDQKRKRKKGGDEPEPAKEAPAAAETTAPVEKVASEPAPEAPAEPEPVAEAAPETTPESSPEPAPEAAAAEAEPEAPAETPSEEASS